MGLFAWMMGLLMWAFHSVLGWAVFLILLLALWAILIAGISGLIYSVARGTPPSSSPTLRSRARACPHCRRPVGEVDVLCSHCYRDLKRNCPRCGEVIRVNAAVCPACRTPLSTPSEGMPLIHSTDHE